MENERLIEEYNRKLKLAESIRQDEQWFRDVMRVISNGSFTCYGQGKHLCQEGECAWNTIYELLSRLNGVNTIIRFKTTKNEYCEIEDEYKCNRIIENAISNGWIQVEATLMEDKNVKLYRCLDWDVGDSGNFGRWTINLMAYLDKDGNFIKPFFVVDTRM